MHKAPTAAGTLKWVGIDLHVHTPASDDYQGPKERSEYLKILQQANEFEDAEARVAKPRVKRGPYVA